jgi:hypothetical protein
MAQQLPEQRRLAAAEESREDRDGNLRCQRVDQIVISRM